MVKIDNQFNRALSLLVSQFRDQKPDGTLTNLQKMIQALVTPAQQLEDVNWELKTLRWLSTSYGQQLDEIGIILGLLRTLNESDEDYRERLQFQIFINNSGATPEESITVLAFLTRATKITYYEARLAFYQMETNGLKFPIPPNDLNDAIFSVSPAGVNYVPIIATYDVPISFEFSGDLSNDILWVAPLLTNPDSLTNLELEPYSALLYVSAGNVEEGSPDGGFDELNFPLPTAGQLSELIQKGGNFPPRRFQDGTS